MKKKVLKGLILTFLAILMSCGVCFADLLSVLHGLPTGNADKNPCSRITVRLTDASKLIEDLYPIKLIEAMEPLSSGFGFDDFIKPVNVAKALSKSNIREVAALFVIDKNYALYDGGVIVSVPEGKKILDEADESGKLTLFELLSSLGKPVLEAMKAADILKDDQNIEFKRDSDGIFFYDDNYVFIEGDKIISFKTKEGILSVVKAIKSGVETKVTDLKFQNILLVHTSKEMTKTLEDMKLEVGISYDNSTWKIKTITNAFRLMSKIHNIEGKALEKAQKVLETLPMVGKGEPFFISGGNTFLVNGLESIEEQLMATGDMTLTLNWATFLQLASQYGISKYDLGNLLAGSVTAVLGLDTKFYTIPLPLGGYFALTGKDKAAENITVAANAALAEMKVTTEAKVDGWDKVYTLATDPSMPGLLIAQKGETFLVGVMDPEDLRSELNAKEIGITEEKMLSWCVLNTEKIWKAVRSAYVPLSAMAMSGMFGKISDNEKEIVKFTQHLIRTDFPVNTLNFWLLSPEELDINILMNPSPAGDFWKVFFEWLVKVLDR